VVTTKTSKIDTMALSLRTDGPSVSKITHFTLSQSIPQIWRLENITVLLKQVT
jgi:hypothetical protein